MNEPTGRDDLFLDALESDEDVAWKLAVTAACPAPPALRERIVARHRRSERALGFPRIALAAVAAAVLLVLVGAASGGRVVTLDAAPGAPGGVAVVAVAADRGYLLMALPAPPSGKAYEAWIIRDGQPLPAGVSEGRGMFALGNRALKPGDVIAVTIEVAAGVTRPTSAPILTAKV